MVIVCPRKVITITCTVSANLSYMNSSNIVLKIPRAFFRLYKVAYSNEIFKTKYLILQLGLIGLTYFIGLDIIMKVFQLITPRVLSLAAFGTSVYSQDLF